MSGPPAGHGRVVGVWARPADVEPALAHAMLEDVVDLVAGMQEVRAVIVAEPAAADAARAVTWPHIPVVEVAAGSPPVAVLDAMVTVGAQRAALVCADVPDLPVLLLGKLFSALTAADVAVCPARGGGLVAAAARLPVAGWAGAVDWSMDVEPAADTDVDPALSDVDVVTRLRRAAPPRGLAVGPGWHRIRAGADVAHLDPGLEGWDATRAYLATDPGAATRRGR